jgi:hypothetical protein
MRNTHARDDRLDCDEMAPVARDANTGDRTWISESWRRSLDAGIDPETRAAPLVYDTDVLADARQLHPLDRHLAMLRHTLRGVADATGHLMVIADADGHVLWSEGPRDVCRSADRVGLQDGFRWSEDAIGTNGIGTCLSVGAPVHVRATDHLVHVLHPWSCVAAPITDPDTGALIGCVDISGVVDSLHPAVISLVEATARLTEAQLTVEMNHQDDQLRARYTRHLRGDAHALVTPTGRILATGPDGRCGGRITAPEAGGRVALPDGRTAIAEPLGRVFLLRTTGRSDDRRSVMLRLLGAGRPCAFVDGHHVPLSLRHAELLALLALNPRGLTGEQSSLYLYGDTGNPATVRAEIHRLRAQLGDVVRAKPYRLDCEVEADFLNVRRLLAAGEVTAAAQLYPGPLLPRSESPAIQDERDDLAAQMRRQLLLCGSTEALWTYAETGADDLEILGRLAAVLPSGDPRRVTTRLRERRILEDSG